MSDYSAIKTCILPINPDEFKQADAHSLPSWNYTFHNRVLLVQVFRVNGEVLDRHQGGWSLSKDRHTLTVFGEYRPPFNSFYVEVTVITEA